MDSNQTLQRCMTELETIAGMLDKLLSLPFVSANSPDTAIFVVDMVNGFAKAGALYSPRTEALIPGIRALLEAAPAAQRIAFCDNHAPDSLEFAAYPPHCQAGTPEAEVVDELKPLVDEVITKNTTNGFLEMAFVRWLHENLHVSRYIIVGCCTDICVQQLAVSLKTFFIHNQMEKEIIVPVNLVDTYDIPGVHGGDLMHLTALASMQGSGVQLVRMA